ncbi:MAG: tyrosine recombinase XerC [Candidatus Rifleibacteriota bacterium]
MPTLELFRLFFQYLEKERLLSANTLRAYKNDLKPFFEWLEQSQQITSCNQLEHLTLAQIRAYWTQRRMNGLSQQSMRRGQSSLRTLFLFARKRSYIENNPVKGMASPKRKRPLPKALSGEDINLLLNIPPAETTLGKRDRAILETLYGSGMRISELTGLKIANLDWDQQTARITGKGNKERIVPLTPTSCDKIKTYLRAINRSPDEKRSEFVFLNRYGNQISNRSVARMIDKYSRELALMINITPHQFRHSFATHLLNNGADIRAVQEMLGHESLSTTQIYTRISKEKLLSTYKNTHPRSGGQQ